MWQILHDGKIDERRLDERVPFLEGFILDIKSFPYTVTDAESAVNMFNGFPEPRVFKTHLPYCLVPKGFDDNKPRYIYVMRNPKDVFVSMYHHLHNMSPQWKFPRGTRPSNVLSMEIVSRAPFFAVHKHLWQKASYKHIKGTIYTSTLA